MAPVSEGGLLGLCLETSRGFGALVPAPQPPLGLTVTDKSGEISWEAPGSQGHVRVSDLLTQPTPSAGSSGAHGAGSHPRQCWGPGKQREEGGGLLQLQEKLAFRLSGDEVSGSAAKYLLLRKC